MKGRCTGLAAVLLSFFAFGTANADIEFSGVLDPMTTVTVFDSVGMTPPDTVFLTPGWGSDSGPSGPDTFAFTGVPAWPETLVLHGTTDGVPMHKRIPYPRPDTWYLIGLGIVRAKVMFYGDYGGVEESKPVVAHLPRLTVSPSVVTGQMTIRLQAVGTSRPVIEIHDAVGNVVRTLGCTAGSDGIATATWNREDDYGRLVPEGVYFCRYANSDVVAVRKVLVVH